jgi:hypothetical protein
VNANIKICTQCAEAKPRTEFFANKVCADGLQFHCKECHKILQRRYREAHPGRAKEQDDKWRAKNQQWARELDALKAKRWRSNNPETAKAVSSNHNAKRRARCEHLVPFAEPEKMKLVYRKAKEFGFHVDHIVPLHHQNVSGLHVWNNLQLLDPLLNRRKQNTTWPEQPTEE